MKQLSVGLIGSLLGIVAAAVMIVIQRHVDSQQRPPGWKPPSERHHRADSHLRRELDWHEIGSSKRLGYAAFGLLILGILVGMPFANEQTPPVEYLLLLFAAAATLLLLVAILRFGRTVARSVAREGRYWVNWCNEYWRGPESPGE